MPDLRIKTAKDNGDLPKDNGRSFKALTLFKIIGISLLIFKSGIAFIVTVKSGWKKGNICSIICKPASALAVKEYKL